MFGRTGSAINNKVTKPIKRQEEALDRLRSERILHINEKEALCGVGEIYFNCRKLYGG